MTESLETITARLRDILVDERHLLKAMDVRQLVVRSEEKLQLTKALDAALAENGNQAIADETGRVLEKIVQLARENGQYFNAVRQGMTNVIDRISQNSETTSAGTYNQYGEQLRFRGAAGGYLRKA